MPPRRSKRVQEKETGQGTHVDEDGSDSKAPQPQEAPTKSRRIMKRAGSNEQQMKGKVTFELPFGDKHIVCQTYDGPPDGEGRARASMIFTHGAGGGIGNTAVVEFAQGFASTETILCFEGNMNLKSRVKYFEAILAGESTAIALGGRSMGARAATITATEHADQIRAVILCSFPLLSGQTGNSREDILLNLPQPVRVLFITGDKDSMCDLAKLQEVRSRMSAESSSVVVEGADHSMSLTPKRAIRPIRVKTGQIAAHWLRNDQEGRVETVVRWNDETSQIEVDKWQPATDSMREDDSREHKPARKRQRKK